MGSRLRRSSVPLHAARCRQRQQKTKSSEPKRLRETTHLRGSNAMTSSMFSGQLGIVRRPDNDLAGPWFPMEQRDAASCKFVLNFIVVCERVGKASPSASTQRASSSSESLLGFYSLLTLQ